MQTEGRDAAQILVRTPGHAAADPRTTAREGWLAVLQASFHPWEPPAEAALALLPLAHAHSLSKGERLLCRTHAAQRLWLLLAGRVVLGVSDDARMRQQTREVGSGHWIDTASALLGPDACYLEDAVADSDALVWSFTREDFMRCGQRHPALLLGLAATLAGQVQGALHSGLSHMQQSTESRFAGWLLHNAEMPAKVVVLHQRKHAIASQLGVAPETFSRVLKQLAGRGAVNVRGYTIELTDMDLLRQLAAARR